MSTPLTILEDSATPALADLAATLQGVAAKKAAGRGVRNSVVNHLQTKNLQPNKKNWPKTDFYAKAAQSVTQPEADDSSVSVSITAVGIRQRYLGGPINPKDGKKYLTIPAQGFAYGRLASEFTNLKFTFVRNDQGFLCPALVAGEGGSSITGTKPRRSPRGQAKPPISAEQVVFWLVRSVLQKPVESVLPTSDELQAAAISGLRSYLRAKLKNRNAQVVPEEN